jgi:signal transduction histidine kinase
MFLVVSLAAGRATKPIAESYEKQRRFITDAGHELKTPIAIINADTEVMELDSGETEWTRDIKAQTKRLSDLTADLIFLSRMEETDRSMSFIPFPFSDMVVDAAQSFVALAKTQNRTLTVEAEPMLEVNGDEKALRQLVGILLDNAIKYSPEGGEIELKAYKSGKNVMLSVTNDAENVTRDSVKHMFDRFYRGDESREKKPGYGIGLSIAKAVCEAHKGKITADYADGKVKIIVAL